MAVLDLTVRFSNLLCLIQHMSTTNLESTKFVLEIWLLCSHFYDVDIEKQIYFLKKTSEFIDSGLVVDM